MIYFKLVIPLSFGHKSINAILHICVIFGYDMPLLQAQFARYGLQALHVPEGWPEFHFVGMLLIHDEIDLHTAFPLVVIHLGLSGKGGKNGVLEQSALANAREPVQQARIAKIRVGVCLNIFSE